MEELYDQVFAEEEVDYADDPRLLDMLYYAIPEELSEKGTTVDPMHPQDRLTRKRDTLNDFLYSIDTVGDMSSGTFDRARELTERAKYLEELFGLPRHSLAATMRSESDVNPNARVSDAGARSMAQLRDLTVQDATNLWLPRHIRVKERSLEESDLEGFEREDAEAGIQYKREMLQRMEEHLKDVRQYLDPVTAMEYAAVVKKHIRGALDRENRRSNLGLDLSDEVELDAHTAGAYNVGDPGYRASLRRGGDPRISFGETHGHGMRRKEFFKHLKDSGYEDSPLLEGVDERIDRGVAQRKRYVEDFNRRELTPEDEVKKVPEPKVEEKTKIKKESALSVVYNRRRKTALNRIKIPDLLKTILGLTAFKAATMAGRYATHEVLDLLEDRDLIG